MAIRLEMEIQFPQDAFGHWFNISGDCQDRRKFLGDSKGRQLQKPGLLFLGSHSCNILLPRLVLSPLSFLPHSLQGSPQPGFTLSWQPCSPSFIHLSFQSQLGLLLIPIAHPDLKSSMPPKVHELPTVMAEKPQDLTCLMLDNLMTGNSLPKCQLWANSSSCCSQGTCNFSVC